MKYSLIFGIQSDIRYPALTGYPVPVSGYNSTGSWGIPNLNIKFHFTLTWVFTFTDTHATLVFVINDKNRTVDFFLNAEQQTKKHEKHVFPHSVPTLMQMDF
jgi:hypothetical protein